MYGTEYLRRPAAHPCSSCSSLRAQSCIHSREHASRSYLIGLDMFVTTCSHLDKFLGIRHTSYSNRYYLFLHFYAAACLSTEEGDEVAAASDRAPCRYSLSCPLVAKHVSFSLRRKVIGRQADFS